MDCLCRCPGIWKPIKYIDTLSPVVTNDIKRSTTPLQRKVHGNKTCVTNVNKTSKAHAITVSVVASQVMNSKIDSRGAAL